MPTYDRKDVADACALAERLELESCGLLCGRCPEQVIAVCNGIGPEWMCDTFRKLLGARFHLAEVPAMIHDLRYQFGCGTEADFRDANEELERNVRKVVADRHPWYSLLRYRGYRDARKLRLACQACGWRAYEEAIAARRGCLCDACAEGGCHE